MLLNNKVSEYKIKHVLELYQKHPDEITRDYIKENQARADYEGREILELLQNAVDQVDIGGKIYLEIENDILTVANTGEPFNFDGVKSLMKENLSPKRSKQNMIGQKGLGFRSLLNWSNEISIFSDQLSIKFSESYRNDYFNKFGIKEPTALLVCPEIIENTDTFDFNTMIKIKIIDDNIIHEVKRQLNSIDKYTLLFLNKVNEISVRINDKLTVFNRKNKDDFVIISEKEERFEFKTYSKKGIIDDKNFEIVIAYDETINSKKNKLYSFFETNIDFPIKWKCHATFELESNRGGIEKNQTNLSILFELAEFICIKASELFETDNNTYEAFDSIQKISNFSSNLNIKGIDFNDTFQKYFENAQVLPTYSGDKVALKSKPIFYESTPFFFSQIKNLNILIESKDENRNQLIERYCTQFDDNAICNLINNYSHEWSVSQCIDIFLWWEREFSKSNLLPNLIKSMDGNYIESNSFVYFVRGRELNIPTWSNVYQLDPTFEEELKIQIQKIESVSEELSRQPGAILERVIAQKSGSKNYYNNIISHITFRDADASTILTPVNASINDNYEYAVSFVKWLWNNYSKKEDWTAPLDLVFNLPTKDKTVVKANNIYFDETYDNLLGKKLFLNPRYSPFSDFRQFEIDNELKKDFKIFISKLGVSSYPPFVKRSIHDEKFSQLYKPEYLINRLKKNLIDARNPRSINLTFNCIEDLETILLNLKVDEIFKWIQSDEKLYDELKLKHPGKVTFNYTALIQANREFEFNDYSMSYIKHVFKYTSWLVINSEKHSPNLCVFAYSGVDISKIVPVISNKMIKEIADLIGIKQKETREFLIEIGVNTSIIQLESNAFYKVLLDLPKYDESGQISEKIYREIIDFDGEIIINSENYKKFLKEGLVFARNHDGKKYHLANDTYFSNSIQVNVGNYYIIRTPLRNGSFEAFKRIFGVKKFEDKYKVNENSIILHRNNHDFQQNFSEFSNYARAWSEKNENIKRRIDNIKVNIVSRITLLDNNEELSIQRNYKLLFDNNAWYIYLNKDDNIDSRMISNCIEELFAQVANTTSSEIPNQLGELYRDREGRKFLVEKHFGTIDVINQSYQNSIKENLASALNISYDSEELKEIDFEHFSSSTNSKSLINLLRKYSIDLVNLKDNGFEYIESINLRDYYNNEIRKYIAENEDKYKMVLYNEYLSKKLNDKKTFYDKILYYNHFNIKYENILNSVNYDIKGVIKDHFLILNTYAPIIDVDKLYNENFDKISSSISNDKFADFIDENNTLRSLIYFLDDDVNDFIKKEFNSKFEYDLKTSSNQTESHLEKDEIVLKNSKIKSLQVADLQETSTINVKTKTKSSIEKENKSKDKNGKLAEILVKNKLIEKYPSLKWTSENSDIPSERNTSTKYDMEYMKHGEKYFIEVKSSNQTFFMSKSEYDFAKKNEMNYELYLVDFDNHEIDGPHRISEFESSKVSTQFQFSYIKLNV